MSDEELILRVTPASFDGGVGDDSYWWARSLNNPQSFRASAAAQGRCAGCGRQLRFGDWHAHHVLHEQHLAGAPKHHPDNVIALCSTFGVIDRCHAAHHARSKVVSCRMIPDDAVCFVAYWMGVDRAVIYLSDHYADACTDNRCVVLTAAAGSIPERDLVALRDAVYPAGRVLRSQAG